MSHNSVGENEPSVYCVSIPMPDPASSSPFLPYHHWKTWDLAPGWSPSHPLFFVCFFFNSSASPRGQQWNKMSSYGQTWLKFDAAQLLAPNQRVSLCSCPTKMYPKHQKKKKWPKTTPIAVSLARGNCLQPWRNWGYKLDLVNEWKRNRRKKFWVFYSQRELYRQLTSYSVGWIFAE